MLPHTAPEASCVCETPTAVTMLPCSSLLRFWLVIDQCWLLRASGGARDWRPIRWVDPTRRTVFSSASRDQNRMIVRKNYIVK
jgi:hypothetical protein